MNNRHLIPAALTLLIFCSLQFLMAQTPSPNADASGIEGVIVLSPSRPGPIRKDTPNSAPLKDIEFEVRKGEQAVRSFTTDGEGRFRVMLPPGKYVVQRKDWNGRIGHFGPFEVEVVAGQMATVEWRCDSGMR